MFPVYSVNYLPGCSCLVLEAFRAFRTVTSEPIMQTAYSGPKTVRNLVSCTIRNVAITAMAQSATIVKSYFMALPSIQDTEGLTAGASAVPKASAEAAG